MAIYKHLSFAFVSNFHPIEYSLIIIYMCYFIIIRSVFVDVDVCVVLSLGQEKKLFSWVKEKISIMI